jgi:NCAIR mutase (PurE)-related protein
VNPQHLHRLLRQIADREITVDDAVSRLRTLPFEDLGFARVDHHRALRCGMPEVIFGRGKKADQIVELFRRLGVGGDNVLATRIAPRIAARVRTALPELGYEPLARTLSWRQRPPRTPPGFVAVLCAGTADLPVAEEARVTAEMLDLRVQTCYDVGVAGLHRLLACLEQLRSARVLIVVAGMEGALPSVVAGLVEAPVIAVPTSVGYGASFGGVAALLAMLNSCAAGVTVVNIDNGFAAAAHAARIMRRSEKAPHAEEQPRDRGASGREPDLAPSRSNRAPRRPMKPASRK